MPHHRFSFKNLPEYVEPIDKLRTFLGKLGSNYLTARPPEPEPLPEEAPPPAPISTAFYVIRALLSALLLGEIPYQLVTDWLRYQAAGYHGGLKLAHNVTVMLLVQTLGLIALWGPKLTYGVLFMGVRFVLAKEAIKKNHPYGVVHLTAVIYTLVFCAFYWNAFEMNKHLFDLLSIFTPIKSPSVSYAPYSRLSYNLVRFTSFALLLVYLALDIEELQASDSKVGKKIVEGAYRYAFLIFGLLSIGWSHFYRLAIFFWGFLFGDVFPEIFQFSAPNLNGLLSVTIALYVGVQLSMTWKIAGGPAIIGG